MVSLFRPCTILVVDDDYEFFKEFVTRFHKSGLSINENQETALTYAPNAEEGLRIFAKMKPDILLTDHWMPGMTGVDLIKRIMTMDHKPDQIFLMSSDKDIGGIPKGVSFINKRSLYGIDRKKFAESKFG